MSNSGFEGLTFGDEYDQTRESMLKDWNKGRRIYSSDANRRTGVVKGETNNVLPISERRAILEKLGGKVSTQTLTTFPDVRLDQNSERATADVFNGIRHQQGMNIQIES